MKQTTQYKNAPIGFTSIDWKKKRIHLSNFIELEIPNPSLNEQNPIAEILNTANQKAT